MKTDTFGQINFLIIFHGCLSHIANVRGGKRKMKSGPPQNDRERVVEGEGRGLVVEGW